MNVLAQADAHEDSWGCVLPNKWTFIPSSARFTPSFRHTVVPMVTTCEGPCASLGRVGDGLTPLGVLGQGSRSIGRPILETAATFASLLDESAENLPPLDIERMAVNSSAAMALGTNAS
jgi:hypothetical protein